jgi:hypothetical protein
MQLNISYFSNPIPIGIIEEAIFHELDHARTAYNDTSNESEMPTGIIKYPYRVKSDLGDNLTVQKGIALTESVATYNGEMVFHSFHNIPWRKTLHQSRYFPRHEFPSGYWCYQHSGNFHSQIAAALGIRELDLCKIVETNERGRQVLQNGFTQLTDDESTFDRIEDEIDLIHCVQDKVLAKEYVSPQLINTCDKNIDNVEINLSHILRNAYKSGKIAYDEFVRRHNILMKYVSSQQAKENIINNLIADGAVIENSR